MRREIKLFLILLCVFLTMGAGFYLGFHFFHKTAKAPHLKMIAGASTTNDFKADEDAIFELGTNGFLKSKEVKKGHNELSLESGKIVTELLKDDKVENQDIIISKEKNQDESLFTIQIPQNQQFKPGRYKLKITLSAGKETKTIEQDFSWGVLALNLDKSSYKIDKTANIGIGVLNDAGKTVCDAKVWLKIIGPNGQATELSTENKTVAISDTCANGNVTNIPDYSASYIPKTGGNYQIELKAETANGPRSLTESFEVLESPDFVISRPDTSMRIVPTSIYAVNINVLANKDLTGGVKEKIPASFEISNVSFGGQIIDKNEMTQTIEWPTSLKADESIKLSYEYDAPDISPEFYLLGPIEIWQPTINIDGDQEGAVNQTTIFTEPRPWQIASDYGCAVAAVTGARNWNDPATWTSCNSSYPGASGNTDTVSITAAQAVAITANVSVTVASITFPTGTVAQSITVSSGVVLTVTGAVSITTGAATIVKEMAAGAGRLTVGGLITVAAGSTTGRVARLSVTTGILDIDGGVTFTGSGDQFVNGSSGATVNFTGGTISAGAATFTFNAGSTLNSTGTCIMNGAYTFGILTIPSGTLTLGGVAVTFAGATTITGGTLLVSSATGTKTFTGLVTVTTGSFNLSGYATVTSFANGITMNGTTFNSGTGNAAFSTRSQAIQGSSTMTFGGAVTPASGFTITNSNSGGVTINGTLTLTGNWAQADGGVLNLAAATATSGSGTFSASTATNTVNYTGTGQTVKDPTAGTLHTYYHLGLSGSGAKVLTSITTVSGNMAMSGSCTATTAAVFAITGSLDVSGTAALTIGAFTFSVGTTTHIDATASLIFSSATNPGKTFTGDVTIDGVWDAGAYNITPIFSGNLTNNATTWTVTGTGTYTFSGSGKTISGTTVTSIPFLTINGATGNSGTLDVQTTLAGSNTLTNNASATLIIGASTASLTLTGLTASASTNLVKYDGAAGQTIKDTIDHHYSNLEIACPGQTATLAAAVIVDNDLTITSGTLDTSGTSYSITLAGNWANSGTFTPNAGTVTFNKGSSFQTLNSGGVGAGTIFNNLTHSGAGTLQLLTNPINIDGIFTNSSGTFDANDLDMNVADDFLISGGSFTPKNGGGATTQTVTFDGTNGATISGSNTFNNLTMDSSGIAGGKTITFTAGTTQTITASKTWTLDGAAGNILTLNSSTPTSAWNFNISAGFTSGDYINVCDSWSANANKITPGSNVTECGGDNNDGWIFISNVAPINDSLTFTNRYGGSGNTAIADNTTSWDFQAKVTDNDGPTDLSTVTLRMANGSDSETPYDSLRIKWTRTADPQFTLDADSQSAATIMSVNGDASSDGNQWTLNFKIKINNNFSVQSPPTQQYAAELYSVDSVVHSDLDPYADFYQVTTLFLDFDVTTGDTIPFGPLLPGSVVRGTTITTVTTNYPNGYALAVHDGSATNSALAQDGVYIADYTGTITTPTVWPVPGDTGLGICVYIATGKDTAKWGTGVTEDDALNKYAGVPETATTIHAKTGSPTSGDDTSIGYKLVVPNTQKTGNYAGDVTYTATGVLL